MSSEHEGPEAPSVGGAAGEQVTGQDAWGQSAGHVGAPPPPSWGTPPTVEPGKPPPDGTPADDQPAARGRRKRSAEGPGAVDAYGVPAYQTTRRSRSWSSGYRTGYRSGRARSRTAPRPAVQPVGQIVIFAVIGFVTWGVVTLVGAVLFWRRSTQAYRNPDTLRVARTWRIGSVVLAVIAALTLAFWILVVTLGNSTSDATYFPPPVTHTVPLGSTITMDADFADEGKTAKDLAQITLSDLNTSASVPDVAVNTSVNVKVCSINHQTEFPGVYDAIELETNKTSEFQPIDVQYATGTPATEVAKGACNTETDYFDVPSGQTVTDLRFDGGNDVTGVWTAG